MSLVTLTATYTIYTTHKHINIHLHYYTLITILGIYALNFLSKLYSDIRDHKDLQKKRKKKNLQCHSCVSKNKQHRVRERSRK